MKNGTVLFYRTLRRQRAVNRARLIRAYRKGRPKLGCYTCGYDCYELEADRCPECNAPIERNPPWWRDGRHSLPPLVALALLNTAISVAGVLWLNSGALATAPHAYAPFFTFTGVALARFPIYFGLPILLWLAIRRTRAHWRSAVYRGWVVMAPTFFWAAAASLITW